LRGQTERRRSRYQLGASRQLSQPKPSPADAYDISDNHTTTTTATTTTTTAAAVAAAAIVELCYVIPIIDNTVKTSTKIYLLFLPALGCQPMKKEEKSCRERDDVENGEVARKIAG